MRIGKPKSGGRENFKMEDGDNVYRILPPLGELADDGMWVKYYGLAWGYKGTDGKMKPFVDPSVKNRSNGQIEIMSAALARRMQLEIKQKEMKEAGANDEQMKEMSKIMMQYNMEKKYYVNAVNLKGQVGILKIGYKAYKALTGDKKTNSPGVLKQLNALDPTANLVGAYINFNRVGRGFDTQYTVTPYQEDQGDGSFRIKTQTIDEVFYAASIKNIESVLNLTKLYPSPSLDEVQQIVNGGPEVVDAILGKKPVVDNSTAETKVEARTEAVAEDNAKEAPVVPTLADLKATAGVAPVAEQVVDLNKALENNPVSVATTASEVTSEQPTTPAATVQNAAEMDPNEFLKSLGVQNT